MTNNERIANGLRCMAVCDAVGYNFEFVDNLEFEKESILKVAKRSSLSISDDTQMTLFGFESVLDKKPIKQSYLDWYKTQTRNYRDVYTGLLSFEELWVDREPGMTCMKSLQALSNVGNRLSNNSSGCGAVMRLLPMMLLDDPFDFVEDSISVTHDNIECFEAAALLHRAYHGIYSIPEETNIAQIGQGWTSIECVRMAIWAVHNSKTFDELLVNSIWHDGDSDSVAAVAGSIWGYLGRPFDYYDRVVEQAPIEYIINKL